MTPTDLKNRNTLVIIGGGDMPENMEDSMDARMGLVSCAEDVLAAIKENDPEALADALESCWLMCESMEGDEDQGPPEEGMLGEV
jgi:hypothetical protein